MFQNPFPVDEQVFSLFPATGIVFFSHHKPPYLQTDISVYSSHHVVQHNTTPALHDFLNFSYWRGFQNIKNSEKNKTGQKIFGIFRDKQNSKQITAKFVNNYAAAVFPESLFSTAGSYCTGDKYDKKEQEQGGIIRFKERYQRKTQD
jgi:hypothetical protein